MSCVLILEAAQVSGTRLTMILMPVCHVQQGWRLPNKIAGAVESMIRYYTMRNIDYHRISVLQAFFPINAASRPIRTTRRRLAGTHSPQ